MAQTLLLVDDSITIQRVIELTFAEQGIKVVSMSDGQQAIDHLADERPDIALIGVNLQKVDGYDVAAFMHRKSSLRGVPVLLLAGAFDTLDEARVRESGAAGVVIKPFEPKLVINRVKELLGMAAKQAVAAPLNQPPPTNASADGQGSSDDGPPRRARDEESSPDDTPTPPRREQAWDELRQKTGLASDAAPVEAAPSGGEDYFEQLDAAFDTLDAQLSGRGAPAGRPTNAPRMSRYPAALDPGGRRPAVPTAEDPLAAALPHDHRTPAAAHQTAPSLPEAPGGSSMPPAAENPVFEVDAEWFPPAEGRDQANRGDAGATIDSPAASLLRASASGHTERTAPLMAEPAVTFAPPAPHPGAAAPPPGAAVAMADVFAQMFAEEQGHATPPASELPPQTSQHVTRRIDLSEEDIDRIAIRVGDVLTHGLLGETLRRTVAQVSERLVREEIARIRAATAPKR